MTKTILTASLVGLSLTFSTATHAADPDNSPESRRNPPPIITDYEANQGSQGLEQRMSPEQRQRFNRDMETQTGEAYPDHAEIESRRQKMRERMKERMQQADTDNDNSLTRAEAEENMPGVARHFDQFDANHDGVITYEELKAAQERKFKAAEQQVTQAKEEKTESQHAKKPAHKKSRPTQKESAQNAPSGVAPAEETNQQGQ
jgi:hypothetical protein